MKKSILFLPASIRSHVVPALYVADLLAEEYDIYFAVTSEVLEEIVTKQGYNAIRTSTFRVGLGMEGRYLFEKTGRRSKWATLKSVLNNDLFAFRQHELSEMIDRIKPTAIFIDIFNSTDILVLYAKYREIKDGKQISFEYTTYGNSSKSCQAPSSGSAYYSYSRNGRNYSGYIDSSSAADLCGYSTTQATYVVN